ncbi:MAG: hypothetical protein QXP98_04265 [Thermoproteus sp.]
MKFATASILFSLVAFASALILRGVSAPQVLPVYLLLAVIDVVLFVLGRRDAAASLDIAANEREAAELKALMALLIVLFVLSIIALGYSIVSHIAPSVFG